jgi:hypothetical protein
VLYPLWLIYLLLAFYDNFQQQNLPFVKPKVSRKAGFWGVLYGILCTKNLLKGLHRMKKAFITNLLCLTLTAALAFALLPAVPNADACCPGTVNTTQNEEHEEPDNPWFR